MTMVKMLVLMFLLIIVQYCRGEIGLCEECDCFPREWPIQAFCDTSISGDKQITFSHDLFTRDLELLYIHGYNSISLTTESIHTTLPITVLIYQTKNVTIFKSAFSNLRSLTIAHVEHLRLKEFALAELSDVYTIRLRYIKELIIETNAIQNIHNLLNLALTNVHNIEFGKESINLSSNETEFEMRNCSVTTLPSSGITIVTNTASIDHCSLKGLSPNSLNITAIADINFTNNKFIELYENSLIFRSEYITLSFNSFKTLAAKSLKSLEVQDTIYFTDNVIDDIDLGGVLLYMEYRQVQFLNNTIKCNCLPTVTSLLKPQEGFPFIPVFPEIFENNFCRSDCNLTLMEFSFNLVQEHVCQNNKTKLTNSNLCNLTQIESGFTNAFNWSFSIPSRAFMFEKHHSLLLLVTGYFCLKYS